MYLQFFGFTNTPFSDSPDVRLFWEEHASRVVFSQLFQELLGGCRLQVVSAEPGLGKSMLCRRLLNLLRAHKSRFEVSFAPFPMLRLGYQPEKAPASAIDRHKVLLVDEAQSLSTDSLLMLAVALHQDKRLQAILFGHPELLSNLQSPDLYQLQELDTRFHTLAPLSEAETASYIKARLHMAGADSGLFDEALTPEIHRCTTGIPRLINILMRKALIHACEEQSPRLTLRHIRMAGSTTAAVAAITNQ